MGNMLSNILLDPLQQLGVSIMEPIPWIVAAIVVLILGYIVGCIFGWLVKKVLDKVQFEHWVYEKAHLKKLFKGFKLNEFMGLVVKWYVFVWFFAPAADLVSLYPLATILLKLSAWIPNLIGALLMGFFGFIAADYVHARITKVKGRGHQFIADVTRIVIFIFTGLVVLEQIGIQVSVAKHSFLIVLGGIALAFALAVGISLGLGMQKDAVKYVKQLKKKL